MYKHLSGRLKQLGIKQSDLAKRWSVSQAAISHRFCGKTPWTIDEMYDLMDLCGAPYEELHLYFPTRGNNSNVQHSIQVHETPLYLLVRIEQPTAENLQISCSVQQYKVT